jgi:hypothetical protein
VQHARNTALILSSINPHYIRMRPLVPRIGTPLFEEYQRGELELLSPHGYLREIETTVEDLNISGRICFDHFLNPSLRVMEGVVHLFKQDYEGYKFPEERGEVLKLIEYGLDVDEAKFIHMEELIRLPYI